MHWLDELLQTLAICRRALGPTAAVAHEARLQWIEQLLHALVSESALPTTGRRRGGDPAHYPLLVLSRVVLEHTRDLISVLDGDGTYVYPNPAHMEVLGYAPGFLFGTSAFRLVHPDDLLLAHQHWERLKQRGHAQVTLRYRHANGSYRFLEAHGVVAMRGNGGQIVIVSRDVTDRRRAELEARASDERFRLLVDGITDYAICMLDPVGRVISWNSGAERMLGYREAEIVGRHVASFYPVADVARGLPDDVLCAAVTSGEVITEGVHVRKDGSPFLVRDVVTSLYDDSVLRGFAKITRDTSERKRVEQQLREHERQYRAVLAALPDRIFRVERDGRVIPQLPEHVERLEDGGAEPDARHVRDIFPHAADRLLHALQEVLASGQHGSLVLAETTAPDRAEEWRLVPCGDHAVLLVYRGPSTLM